MAYGLKVKVVKVLKHFVRGILTIAYCPRRVASDELEVKDSFLLEKEDGIHRVLVLKKGRIFTDLCVVVGVMREGWLYKTFSCQFSDDQECSLLNNSFGIINRFPVRVRGNVVSLLTGGGGNYNYYHWLFDVLPRLFLVKDSLDLDSEYWFLLPDTSLRFQLETMKLLGIPKERLISSSQYPHLIADRLVATSHPKSVNAPSDRQVSEWICDRLRMSFMNKTFHQSKSIFSRFIYISRGDNTNQRVLLGEAELISQLSSRGVGLYILSSLTFEEQVELFSNAEVVIGVHGAGFANLVFAPENTLVIELATQSYCPTMFEDIAFHRNHKYQRIIGDEASPVSVEASKQNIRLSEGQINQVLNMIDTYHTQ